MDSKCKKKIITIPNILSFFRLCLIPLMIWLYCAKNNYILTTVILFVSGLTDILDGFIARRFNMISDFGKALDPVADKLTQIAMLFCLCTRYPLMLMPLSILAIKEVFAAVLGLVVIKKTGKVMGAVWHGKVATFLLYLMMLVHLLWINIPKELSVVLILVCTAMILLSAVLYTKRNLKSLKGKNRDEQS